jgi:hypothetical protein
MPTTAGPNIVEDGLVFYIDPANQRSYPGSGTTVTDIMEKETTTLQSSGMFANNNAGVFAFDGVNNYYQFNPLSINMYSVSIWFNPSVGWNNTTYNSTPLSFDTFKVAIHFGDITGGYDSLLSIWTNDNQSNYYGGSGKTIDATWNHAAFNWETNKYQIYLNGESVTTSANLTPNLINTSYMDFIGVGKWFRAGAGTPFNGDMGPIQIYNRALSASEISQNYNALKDRFN